MKALCILGAALWLATPASLGDDKREFTSSDGSKTMTAKFVRYDVKRDRVTLRLSSGKNLVAAPAKFSKDDQDYFVKTQKQNDMQRAFRLHTDTDSDREKTARGQITIKTKTIAYTFSIENTSDFDFEDLQLKYWVVVEYDNRGDEQLKTINKTETISNLGARSTYDITGPSVKLTLGADASCATCPKIVAAASAIGRDRIIGTKLVVCDPSGNELLTEYSSNRIEQMLASND